MENIEISESKIDTKEKQVYLKSNLKGIMTNFIVKLVIKHFTVGD